MYSGSVTTKHTTNKNFCNFDHTCEKVAFHQEVTVKLQQFLSHGMDMLQLCHTLLGLLEYVI